MNNDRFSTLFSEYQAGRLSPIQLAERILADSQTSSSSELQIDRDRARRCGFPEVVFGQGKSLQAIQTAIEKILEGHEEALVTRVDPSHLESLCQAFPQLRWTERSRCIRVHRERQPLAPESLPPIRPMVAIVSAGTTDEWVAQECRETLAWMQVPSRLIQDVGVAGPYRIFPELESIRSACAVVVVAGMEAALASVVGGQVAVPVIAVPTSIGYGANFQGLAALLGMINSCAANVTVVNIDAGFKAAYVAGLISTQLSNPGSNHGWVDRNSLGVK